MVGVGRGIGAACDVAASLGVRPVISRRRDSFSAPAASAAAMATTRTRRGGWQRPQARTTTASTCISNYCAATVTTCSCCLCSSRSRHIWPSGAMGAVNPTSQPSQTSSWPQAKLAHIAKQASARPMALALPTMMRILAACRAMR